MWALNFFRRDRLCKWGDWSYSSWSNNFCMKLASSCCVVSSGATVCWLSSLLWVSWDSIVNRLLQGVLRPIYLDLGHQVSIHCLLLVFEPVKHCQALFTYLKCIHMYYDIVLKMARVKLARGAVVAQVYAACTARLPCSPDYLTECLPPLVLFREWLQGTCRCLLSSSELWVSLDLLLIVPTTPV